MIDHNTMMRINLHSRFTLLSDRKLPHTIQKIKNFLIFSNLLKLEREVGKKIGFQRTLQ